MSDGRQFFARGEEVQRLVDVYSSHARGYAEGWSPVIRPMGRRLLEAMPWGSARRVLDIGTGAGTHLPDVMRLAPGAWVVGVDRSRGMLDLARAYGVPLVEMDAVDLALRDRSIDVAVMAFVLFHLADPVAGLREITRVLRPGGTVGIVTWSEDPEVEASKIVEQELDAHGAQDLAPPPPRRDELMNTPEKVVGLFSAAGLTPLRAGVERFEHQWDGDRLFALRTTFGRSKRKLDSLDGKTRAACLDRVRDRLSKLGPGDFLYRAAVVCGIARRPLAGC